MTFKCIFQVLIHPRLLHYLLNMPTSLPHRHWSWFCNYHISLPPILPYPKSHTHAKYRYFFYFQAFTLGKCQSNLPRCLNQRSGIILDSSFFHHPQLLSYSTNQKALLALLPTYPDSVHFSLHFLHSSPSHHRHAQEYCDNFPDSLFACPKFNLQVAPKVVFYQYRPDQATSSFKTSRAFLLHLK